MRGAVITIGANVSVAICTGAMRCAVTTIGSIVCVIIGAAAGAKPLTTAIVNAAQPSSPANMPMSFVLEAVLNFVMIISVWLRAFVFNEAIVRKRKT